MAKPIRNQLGMGCIRFTEGSGRGVRLIQNQGLVHKAWIDAANTLTLDISKKYFVFEYPVSYEDVTNNEFTLTFPNPNAGSGFATDNFETAEDDYISKCNVKCSKSKSKWTPSSYLTDNNSEFD